MQGTAVSLIKLNFRFSVNKDFLRGDRDDFSDFGGDLSFLRRTEESIVLDISDVVVGFGRLDLFGQLIGYRRRLRFF